MRILTKEINRTLAFVSLAGQSKAETEERKRAKKDDSGNVVSLKTDQDGNPTYSVPVKVIDQDGREQREAYVSVRKPCDIPALVPLRATGLAEINTYGTVTTIVVDELVPATSGGANN